MNNNNNKLSEPPGPTDGRRVTVLFGGPFALLDGVETISKFLHKAVEDLGMRPLGDAVVYDVPLEIKKLGEEPFEDEGGVSGIVVLSTSHIAIHTWPLRNHAVLDVYSCRDFDTKTVELLCKTYFEATDICVHDLTFSLHRK